MARIGQTIDHRWWQTDAIGARLGIAWTPARRVAAAHIGALLATLVVLAIDAGDSARPEALLIGVTLFVAFAALRAASVGSRLAISTLALDAVGTALFVAGTGAPASVYFFLALVGAWWAAHVPRRGSGLLWGIVFVAAYGALVVPDAVRDRLLVRVLEDASVVIIVGVLADRFVRVNGRALLLDEAMQAAPFGADQLAMREALARTLRTMDVPVDVVLAAGQLGLTAIQAELLAYLVLGLTNLEIAEATQISEAAVRYRLTRLYRTLGVIGRREARRRAIELGIRGLDADQLSASRS